MSTQFFSKLSQNFIEILEDSEYYDITIEVGKDPNVKIFRAHMNILCYRSPYLRRTLASNKKNNNDGVSSHIKLLNILPEIFQILLRYIYGGILSLDVQDTSDFLKVLVAADELLLHELVDYLQIYLIENKADWIENYFELVHRTSFQYNNLLKLQKFCTELMAKFPKKIFKSLGFISLPEKSLISLLKKDDLQMKEIEVWEHVLKWGLAKNPTLLPDPTTWTVDDFKTMESSLQSFLPFIRFYNLSSKNFLEKVHPYKKLLKHQLYEDLLKYYLVFESEPINNHNLSPRNFILDSKIINVNNVSLISKWIDKLDNIKLAYRRELYLPYEFKLLLRGSRDGFTPNKFHSLCNNKPKTVTFMKVKGTEEILGGYNPIIWTNGGWGNAKDSFIFSFKNKNNLIKDEIISNVKQIDHALNYYKTFGPSFGWDLVLRSSSEFENEYNGNYCKQEIYEKMIRDTEGKFSIEDYEVFQIINKNE